LKKADLHVHSKHSEHPSDWFLQRIGAAESYTEPETIYTLARERGMDFVTLTDHNRIDGALLLQEKYPDTVITGVETTAYFPEDSCKVHILIYGINENEFKEIQHLRRDIYELRDFLKENDIAHSVAHATYSVNGKISLAHLEKLLLLFDNFEGINGARNKLHNITWMDLLATLTPAHFDDLYATYRIEPMSTDPWIKGITGGSDDHAGLYVGKTYTITDASTVDDFLLQLRNKKTTAQGRHNDFNGLAFMIYKIAYDFSRVKGSDVPRSVLSQLTKIIFNMRSNSYRDRLRFKWIKSRKDHDEDTINTLIVQLIDELHESDQSDIEARLEMVYDRIGDISDEFFRIVLYHFEKNLLKGNIEGILRSVSSILPGIFLTLPFFSTLNHLFEGRQLLQELETRYALHQKSSEKRILWFTDTINDLNGVAETLREISWLSYVRKKDIHVVTITSPEKAKELPPNVINLQSLYEFKLPYYEHITLKIPSILKAIKTLHEFEPDEIYISTPGPIGLLGLLLTRLLKVRSVNIYHTDFAIQAREIVNDESIPQLVESFMRWFYSATDEIRVPTREYMHILERRGLPREGMKLFKRAIDSRLFTPRKANGYLQSTLGITDGRSILYAGRVSQDKNLDFLAELHQTLLDKGIAVNCIIAGDGPYLDELKTKMRQRDRIFFTGRLPRESMPELYSAADLLVFPSTTDTFGMVVLEAQACGLPAIVSDVGGPKEIVIDGKTGAVVESNKIEEWTHQISEYVGRAENAPDAYLAIREAARENALRYNWESVLTDILAKEVDETQHIAPDTPECSPNGNEIVAMR